MTPEMILFDLDGTLIDSVPDLHYCVNATMADLGLPARSEAAVRTWVGNGVERLVERALADDLDGCPEAELLDEALPIFRRHYAENTSGRSVVYPGVREGLDFVQDAGYRIGCVTNKAEAFTMPLLADKDLLDRFEVVVSGDTLPVKKPDPGPLFYAAGWFRADPKRCLMVGDSRSDVKAARAAGFSVICMSYGYNHGEDIRDYGPDAVIDSLIELPKLVERQ